MLKRARGSSVFLFDHPLTLISYQRQSAVKPPDVLISTAHFSKEKDESSEFNEQSRHQPPAAWQDYRQFLKDVPEPTSHFCSFFINDDDVSNVPLDRILFLDCLYAAAFDAFILWKLQQPKRDEKRDQTVDFKSFLKLLAPQLAKSYISKRLAAPDDVDSGHSSNWRMAAKQIITDLERSGENILEDGAVSKMNSNAGASGSQGKENDDGEGSSKKAQRKQNKKGGKRHK